MSDQRECSIMTRDLEGYERKIMGDHETRGVTTAHLRQPKPASAPKPVDSTPPSETQPIAPARPPSASS